MADKELKLNKRKKASLLNKIQKDVFALIDRHWPELVTADADVIADVVTDVATELRGLMKDIDSFTNDLR